MGVGMNEIKLNRRYTEYIKSDDAAVDVVHVSRTLQRVIFERGYRLGFLDGSSEALTRRSPELEPEPPPTRAA